MHKRPPSFTTGGRRASQPSLNGLKIYRPQADIITAAAAAASQPQPSPFDGLPDGDYILIADCLWRGLKNRLPRAEVLIILFLCSEIGSAKPDRKVRPGDSLTLNPKVFLKGSRPAGAGAGAKDEADRAEAGFISGGRNLERALNNLVRRGLLIRTVPQSDPDASAPASTNQKLETLTLCGGLNQPQAMPHPAQAQTRKPQQLQVRQSQQQRKGA